MRHDIHLPSSAPFSLEQRAWIDGFLAGWLQVANAAVGATEAAPSKPLLILFGSQTGAAETLAKRLAAQAPQHGLAPRLLEMNACALEELTQHTLLLLVTSTWGDGDPPDNAVEFWSRLSSNQAPALGHLAYSVLALGDRNYGDFCGAGRKFDERFAHLGARCVQPRADCDVDWEQPAAAWMAAVWPALAKNETGASAPSLRASALSAPASPAPLNSMPEPGRPAAVNALLLANRKLNALGSNKDTRHFEFALPETGPTYEVGDALGVQPANCPMLVSGILQALQCDGEEAVLDPHEQETSLRHALLNSYSISQIQMSLFQAVAERSGDADLQQLVRVDHQAQCQEWLRGREIVDLLTSYPKARFEPREFVGFLRGLKPRLYSISSSLKAHPGQVHLTVSVVRYKTHGKDRQGVCSTFLAERVSPETPVPVFVQPSRHFRLPTDPDLPILMIGPGTGIAPFRAFLHERRAIAARGRNWLFFGDQKGDLDFLYKAELEEFLGEGTLHKLDTAFSRDQESKVYVQQRLLENAAEVYRWLEEGAHIYVCGDAKCMAKDVDAALHAAVEQGAGKTSDQAAQYIDLLKRAHRYQRDVY